MKIYVAGGSAERESVASVIAALRHAGHVITHDWTSCDGYARESVPDERRRWAREDLDGVRAADLVWLLAPAELSEGSSAELGAVLALRKRVVVSGPHARWASRIFHGLGEIHDTHSAAFEAICGGHHGR